MCRVFTLFFPSILLSPLLNMTSEQDGLGFLLLLFFRTWYVNKKSIFYQRHSYFFASWNLRKIEDLSLYLFIFLMLVRNDNNCTFPVRIRFSCLRMRTVWPFTQTVYARILFLVPALLVVYVHMHQPWSLLIGFIFLCFLFPHPTPHPLLLTPNIMVACLSNFSSSELLNS